MTVKSRYFLGGGDTGLAVDFMALWDGGPTAGKRTIIHTHGQGADWATGVDQLVGTPTYALAAAGYLVIAPNLGDSWSNATCMSLFTNAADYAKNTLGASTSCALFGRSMGGHLVTNWASSHLSRVLGIALDSGALDFAWQRGTDAAHGFSYTDINTAWSIANDAAFVSVRNAHDPTLLAAGAGTLNVPHLIGGWSTDPFVNNDSITNANYIAALATGSPTATVLHTPKVGTSHTGTLDPLDVVTFMQGLGWP